MSVQQPERQPQGFSHPWLMSQVTREFEPYRAPLTKFVKDTVWPVVREAFNRPPQTDSVVWARGPIIRGASQHRDNFIIMHMTNAPTGYVDGGVVEVPFSVYDEDNPYPQFERYRLLVGNLEALPAEVKARWQFLLQVESAQLMGYMKWDRPLPADPREIARLANGKIIAECLEDLAVMEAYVTEKAAGRLQIDFPVLGKQLIRALATPVIVQERFFISDPEVLFAIIQNKGLITKRMAHLLHYWIVSRRLPHVDEMHEVADSLQPSLRKIVDDLGISLYDYLD